MNFVHAKIAVIQIFFMKILFAVCSLSFFLFSCQPASRQPDATEKADETVPVQQAHQFLKVYKVPLNDTVYYDSTILKLHIDQDSVISGTYLWVIPGKDGKYGEIGGRVSHDTIYGHYSYQQEGGNYRDSIQIVLRSDGAVVTQYNAPGSRLVDTLTELK